MHSLRVSLQAEELLQHSNSCLLLSSDQKLNLPRYSDQIEIPLSELPEVKIDSDVVQVGAKRKVQFNLPSPKKKRVQEEEDGYEPMETSPIRETSPNPYMNKQSSTMSIHKMSEVSMYYDQPYSTTPIDNLKSPEPQSVTSKNSFTENIKHLNHENLVNIISDLHDADPSLVDNILQSSSSKDIISPAFFAGRSSASITEDDWNLRFQKAMDDIQNLNPNSSLVDKERVYRQLSDLSTDFIYTVKTYARIIISEVCLPDSQKIIKPVNIGGVAGGAKYIVQKILFKFAIDHKGIHRDELVASKIAGHELKSLIQLLNCQEPGLRYPMMAIVDYRGYRVIGMSMLPISGERSLIHGSCDAAKSVRYHPLVAPKLQSLARKLNLSPHQVGDVLMHLPVDLEVHCSTQDLPDFCADSDLYLLDFSRLFPPEAPSKNRTMDYLYKLLRPELVMQYRESALCSDAFSNFIKPAGTLRGPALERAKANELSINSTVRKATEYLKHNCVRQVGISLCSTLASERSQINIPNFFHSFGVNLRYMGEVRVFVSRTQKDQYWARVILIEMVSRVIKDIVRARLRKKMNEIKHPGEGAYRREVVSLLNLIFGTTRESKHFWGVEIYPMLMDKYYTSEFKSISGNLKDEMSIQLDDQDGRWLLLQRVAVVLGLQFDNSSWVSFQKDSAEHLFSCPKPFEDTDLAEMKGKVKTLDIVAFANGFVLKTKSLLTASSENERKRLLGLAIHSFESALDSNPCNIVSLYNLADCLALDNQLDRAREYYRKSLLLENRNPVALFKYACFKELLQQYSSADKYYNLSISAFPGYATCHVVYADLLVRHFKNYQKAEYHYKEAIRIDPDNRCGCNNYAVFLLTIRHDVENAYKMIKLSVDTDSPNPVHLRNYITFLLTVMKDETAAKQQQELYKKYFSQSK